MSVIQRDAPNDDDIFHAVTMSEEISWQHGYTEGAEEGRAKGFIEGFALGAQKGTDIGQEVGFYAGFSEYLIKFKQNEDHKSRMTKVCKTIIKLASTFEDLEPTDETLSDNLSQIQGKFKQLTSLLGIQVQNTTMLGGKVKGTSF